MLVFVASPVDHFSFILFLLEFIYSVFPIFSPQVQLVYSQDIVLSW